MAGWATHGRSRAHIDDRRIKLSLGERGTNQADVLVYCSACIIYHQVFPIPEVVLSCDDICPGWHRQAWNV